MTPMAASAAAIGAARSGDGAAPATAGRSRMAFVSPMFLFPANTGGRIRTTNILRGLHGGAFEVTLVGPGSPADRDRWRSDLDGICDHFVPWQPARPRPLWARAVDLPRALPINVVADRTRPAQAAVEAVLAKRAFDVVVFDFVHAAVLLPRAYAGATVCFTHNVEAEIFARHAEQAKNPLMRLVWASQHEKMRRFERTALQRFTSVVAVSERDARHLAEHCGITAPITIPTGVDLDYFSWQAPAAEGGGKAPTVVFIGSMDWAANIDGVRHFIDEVWPLVRREEPQARFVVVGRDPPASLRALAHATSGISFTGFVDDVRPYVRAAHVCTIPLRIGGGTRIKAFEAMAMGCPVVSTSIGIEGLKVRDGDHFLKRDLATEQAAAIVGLLHDRAWRDRLSRHARDCVEQHFGHRVAARAFEHACQTAMAVHAARRGSV